MTNYNSDDDVITDDVTDVTDNVITAVTKCYVYPEFRRLEKNEKTALDISGGDNKLLCGGDKNNDSYNNDDSYTKKRSSDDDCDDDQRVVVVADDFYRYLEDPDSDETKAFVTAQNEFSQTHVYPQFEQTLTRKFKRRMKEAYDYAKYSTPFTSNTTSDDGSLFYYKKSGLQNQSVLYRTQDGQDEAKDVVVLDPNTLSEDGTAALGTSALSKGKRETGTLYFAYGISQSGSDWQTIHVLNVFTGEKMSDRVAWVKFSSISWMHDDSGFFYARFPPPPKKEKQTLGTETNANENHQIWFHQIGTSQENDDLLVFAYPENGKYYLGCEVTDDGEHLLIYLRDGCKNACMVYQTSLLTTFATWKTEMKNKKEKSELPNSSTFVNCNVLVNTMEASFDYLMNNGNEFYFQTNLNAPRERIVKCNISKSPLVWTTVVAEFDDQIVLESSLPVGESFLVLKLLVHVKNVLKIFDTKTEEMLYDISLPGIGTALLSCQRFNNDLYYKYISFLSAGSIYKFSVVNNTKSEEKNSPTLLRETKISGFDPSNYATTQVFYPSKDGTLIPMFIVGTKENIEKSKETREGNCPTYLYGYGGFNISIKPTFSIFRLLFMQHLENGILAFPNLRGGSEYGETWHQAGTYEKKQNVFDDFIAAAEYLIAEKYTNVSKIAIHGGSNGGLLVAACANQRPELFACAVAAVGVMDMLRFHKFTCGAGWRTDYGDPDLKSNFDYLVKYSPLHNIPKQTTVYPSTLLLTGDHDDRVVPLHSLKFIAELQYTLGKTIAGQTSPLIIRVETNAGHGAGKPTEKIIDEYATVYGFIAWSLGVAYME